MALNLRKTTLFDSPWNRFTSIKKYFLRVVTSVVYDLGKSLRFGGLYLYKVDFKKCKEFKK